MGCAYQAIAEIIRKVIDQKGSKIEVGICSFLTIDFGKLCTIKRTYKNGKNREYTSGEWHLWVYMCAWRIDKNGRPYVASSDVRTKIAECIKELVGTTLTKWELLNTSLDTKWYFGEHTTLTLFNTSTQDEDQWLLFTPETLGECRRPCMVLTFGPGDIWAYEPSNTV